MNQSSWNISKAPSQKGKIAIVTGANAVSCPEKITPHRKLKISIVAGRLFQHSHSIRKKILRFFFYAMEMWKKHHCKVKTLFVFIFLVRFDL